MSLGRRQQIGVSDRIGGASPLSLARDAVAHTPSGRLWWGTESEGRLDPDSRPTPIDFTSHLWDARPRQTLCAASRERGSDDAGADRAVAALPAARPALHFQSTLQSAP
jgi:hypothetical protein